MAATSTELDSMTPLRRPEPLPFHLLLAHGRKDAYPVDQMRMWKRVHEGVVGPQIEAEP